LSIPTSINASSWSGLLTLAIIVGTLYFLTKIQDNRFASSFPVVAMKKSASSILVSSNNFELVPFPHITSASSSAATSEHNDSSLSIKVMSCPSSINKFARLRPTRPPPIIIIYISILPLCNTLNLFLNIINIFIF